MEAFFRFSRENCENIQRMYMDLDTDGNGLLRYEELKGFRQMTDFFVKRLALILFLCRFCNFTSSLIFLSAEAVFPVLASDLLFVFFFFDLSVSSPW